MYKITRASEYDFAGESYSNLYPNLHPYPATMLPQIAIKILEEINPKNKESLLDPYCGSGTSFCAGIDHGFSNFQGYDINPFAVLLAKARFTKISKKEIKSNMENIRDRIFQLSFCRRPAQEIKLPQYHNINYWFSKDIMYLLSDIQKCIETIRNPDVKRLFLIPFYATVRSCSYTRKGEFKLYRMPEEKLNKFKPDPIAIYLEKIEQTIKIYLEKYQPHLGKCRLSISNKFAPNNFDVVLTSPPYGDSRTTVAYGQFSFFANLWAGFNDASKIDNKLMGGLKAKKVFNEGIIFRDIKKISECDTKRALEISSFYEDLGSSIDQVANTIKEGGFSIYVVGNRTVKSVQLRTDQFIAERFEKNGFKHLFTYKRAIHNKTMPAKNSPTNKPGVTANTMQHEFIVVSQKSKRSPRLRTSGAAYIKKAPAL